MPSPAWEGGVSPPVSWVSLPPAGPNATLQALEIAEAKHERRLFPVACKRLLNEALRAVCSACVHSSPDRFSDIFSRLYLLKSTPNSPPQEVES